MQTETVTPNLIRLTRMRAVNAFLVREDDGFTLVDTTFKGAADDILAAARNHGGEIRRIILTHGHTDHIGSLDALTQKLGPGVEVRIPATDVRVLDGEKVQDGKKAKGGWPKVQTRPDGDLPAGARIGRLEVIETPGHTPGHVSFLDTADRSIIAGDAYAGIGGLTVPSHFRNVFPLPALAAWDKERVLSSARTLRALEPTLLVMGHGPARRDPVAQMDKAIATAQRAAG